MFVQCSKFVKEHQGVIDSISIFGQKSNPGTWKMAKMQTMNGFCLCMQSWLQEERLQY